MDMGLQRVADDLIARLTGPLHFRLIMQPMMAVIFGIRDGWKDAQDHKPPYFWTIFTEPGRRKEFLSNGLRSVAKIMILAVILDAIYQLIEVHRFYPGEAIIVALMLAFIPYLLIRGPANRMAVWWKLHHPTQPSVGTSR